MNAKIIVLANFKGGVGKTTITMELAASLGKRGFRVLIADCDSQASASTWAACAKDTSPFPAAVVNLCSFEGKIHREIQRQVENYDFILIDTPPALNSLPAQAALVFSHLCIVPLPTSTQDLWASFSIKKLIQNSMIVNPNLKAVILPNKVTRTSLSKSILRALNDFGIPLMTSRLTNRTAYQEAVLAGASVADLGRTAHLATDEIHDLTNEVLDLLGDE